MSILETQIIENNINEFGSSITVRSVTTTFGSDEYRIPTETTVDTTLNAFPQILTTEDDLVHEGEFKAGDIIFWFSPDDISYLATKYRIKYNSIWYEISDMVRHDVAGSLQVVEVRTKKI